jgi:hypothetical protein
VHAMRNLPQHRDLLVSRMERRSRARILKANMGTMSNPSFQTCYQPHGATPQGGLCSAEHKDPYAQCRVMRSVGLLGLVGAGSASGHCA